MSARGLATVALVASLFGAQSAQPPTFRTRADLVQVDVVVVDKNGQPVRGLTAADFALLDRQKPQAIASFDEVTHARPASAVRAAAPLARKDVANNQSATSDRLVIIVVDDLHIYKERSDRAKEITRQVLADLGPAASMAVLFTSGEHSTPVTDDRVLLGAAIETLRGRQSWRRPRPAIDAQRGARLDPEMSAEGQLAIISKTQETKVQDFADNMTQYKLLQDAAKMLATGEARRKAFVLISEGIGKELSGLFGAMAPSGQPPGGGDVYAAGGLEGLTVVPPESYHDNALVDMMESLRRSNVATYAIDPRGRVESKDLARECFPAPPTGPADDPCSNGLTAWVSPVRQAQRGLEIMSEASGGFAITNTDDFTSGLARIINDLDHYYLLGFYPADPKGKGYRPLHVTLPGRPDVRLRFRRGYMPGTAAAPAKPGNELVALSAGALPKTALPLRLAAVPMPGSSSMTRVVLVLEVALPRATLEEKDGRLRDRLKYEVLVVDEKQAKVRSLGGLEGAFTLSGNSSVGDAPDVVAYQVTETLELRPGRYEFRVSATSAKLANGGSVYLLVDVPDFRAGSVALGGVTIGYREGARVPIAPRVATPAQRAARVMTPAALQPSALPIASSLDREFTAADTLRVYTEGIVRGSTRPVVTMEVLNSRGTIVRSVSPSFATGDVVKILSDVPLEGLPAGAYILRTRLAAAGADAVRDVGFALR
jgi:VWFA-related protein